MAKPTLSGVPMKRNSYYSTRSFFSYFARYKWRAVVVFVSFAVANVLLAIMPVFIGRLVGDLATHPVRHHAAVIDLVVLIACSVLHDITWHVSEFLYLQLINRASYDYETLVFRNIIHRPYPYFIDKFTGKIASYVTTLSQEFRDMLSNIFYNYTSQVISLGSLVIILSAVNWQTGLIFGGGLLAMYATGRLTVRNSIKYERELADIQSTKNGKIIDAIANFVNVKSFRKDTQESLAIASEQEKTIRAARRSVIWSIVFWGSMGFIVRILIWPVSIGYNFYRFEHGSLTVAGLTTFLSAVLLFSTTIWESVWYVSQYTLKLARIEEAHRYLFGDVNILEMPVPRSSNMPSTKMFTRSLQLKDLSFAYPDNLHNAVLDHVNVTLQRGEKVGFVGKSGSGKTTLTKLLLDYYPLSSGTLLLDGQEVTTTDIAKLVSYVPQDTSLFHRTIAENIAYATERPVSREEIIQAAQQAHADEFIQQLEKGYDALVGERGVKLSGGQRQRIAIARAFLDDKPLLILDEATSALDSESEILVQQALEALWQEKTVIAIAHRLSTLRHMDRLVVMDNGRIVEEGTHQSLLEANGTYAKLWAHQSGGFLDE